MISLNITGHTVEKLVDPFGLLSGDRYEFFLELEIDEEDELFSDKGIGMKVLFVVDAKGSRISHYHLYERETEKILDFALEEDEESLVFDYCKENIGA
ncbi:pullulanase [Rhodococcus qingshengii]|nr:pullulanase [Rhodococcus qingshengii]